MECLLAAVFILILLSVPMSAVGLSLWPSLGEDALKQVARRFSGTYFRGSWFRPPRVSFRYGTAAVLLRVTKKLSATWIEISIHGTKPGMRVEVAPANSAEGLRQLDHEKNIRAVYSLSLDPVRPYNVFAEHEYLAQRFLTDAVVMQLKMIQRYQDSSSMVVTVEPAEVSVRKQWTMGLRLADPLIEFINMTLRLHDNMLLGKEQGIQFVASQGAPDHVKCAICGEEIELDYVACRQCSAPHHLDCWKYNGSCGMYACKEVKYEAVRGTAKPLRWQ